MKAPAYANRPLDFTTLSPRDFEELVYHFFKGRIEDGYYKGQYNDIGLFSGVGEKGIDIGLFYDGKICGVVQCKNYRQNLSPQLILEEIVKFLLHYIQEISQSDQVNPFSQFSDLTYYIVASKGISNPAMPLVLDFNNQWEWDKIEEIAKLSIKKFKELQQVRLEDIESDLKYLLNGLKVSSIVAADLDVGIRNRHELISRFFMLEQGSISNEAQDKSALKWTNSNLDSTITAEQIASFISQDILSVKNYFGNTESNFILRNEVSELHQWILSPIKSDELNLAVLAGNAGVGKSVIVSQLYSKLHEDGIPVVCLKADRLAFETTAEMESELGIESGFNQFIRELINSKPIGVVLIDQIDALSQSLSSNLKPLSVFDRLIKKLAKFNQTLKVIIVSRIYELNYDPIIAAYNNKYTIRVKQLDAEQVKSVLQSAIGQRADKIKSEIIGLLRTPLHLDVFLKIFSDEFDINGINSIQDMYDELWRQKVTRDGTRAGQKVNQKQLVKLAFRLAEVMYEKQQISLAAHAFEDAYAFELMYLRSEGIVVGEKKISFFHQSFFDYVFARQFVNSGTDLLQSITNNHQGLFIRSKVKQILNFKRNVDAIEYGKLLISIIEDGNIRFHIKLLILQFVAFQDEPNTQETHFVEQIISKNNILKETLLKLYFGSGWLDIFIDKSLLDFDLNNDQVKYGKLIHNFFRGFIGRKNNRLLQYFDNIKTNVNAIEMIKDFLWMVKRYDDKNYLQLADYIIQQIGHQNIPEYLLFTYLDNAVTEFPDWSINHVTHILSIPTQRNPGDHEYFPGWNSHTEFYKHLWEYHPRKAYLLVKAVIVEIIYKLGRVSNNPERSLTVDPAYMLYDRQNLDLYFHYKQMDLLQSYMIDSFSEDLEFIIKEVDEYLSADSLTGAIIALSVIEAHPEKCIDISERLLTTSGFLNQYYGLSTYLNYLIESTLMKSYEYFHDKDLIKNVILNFFPKSELTHIDYRNGKKLRSKTYGLSQFKLISAIAQSEKMEDTDLVRRYKELLRKFTKPFKIEAPEGIQVLHGGRVMEDSAYKKMTFEDWKTTFRQYNTQNESYDHWNDPDELSHGRNFKDVVAGNPVKYLQFIKEILIDPTIPQSYKVKGIEGLKEGELNIQEFLAIFKFALANNSFDDEQTLYLLWLTTYISEREIIDQEILDFLKEKSLNGSEKAGVSFDDLTTGMNSVRGAAVSCLTEYSFSPDTKEFVFNVLHQIANNSSPATRACAVYHLQNFIWFDERSTMELCLKLIEDCSPGLVKVSIYPLRYLVNYDFTSVVPFIRKAMVNSDNSKYIGILITQAYCLEHVGSNELMEEYIDLGESQKESVVKNAWNFIKGNSHVKKALTILYNLLNSESENVGEAYAFPFYNLDPGTFSELYNFLLAYVDSPVGRFRHEGFYGYLRKCAGDYPKQCIKLTKLFENQIMDDEFNQMYRNEPLNAIVQSYNAIREYNTLDEVLEEAMDIFDDLLMKSQYRSGAFEVLDKLDIN